MAKKENNKTEDKPLTNAERIVQLKGQQEQIKEAFMKIQGAIEMLEALDEEAK